jgi:hypothetical protein
LVFALVLVFPGDIRAQLATADIVGTVTDNSAAAMAETRITVTNSATNAVSRATTDSSGSYTVSLLPPGRYTVRIEHNGFKVFTASSVDLSIGDRRRIDAQLAIGDLSQSVEVTAQTAALQTDSSTVGQVIGNKQVQELPLNGRNFINLAIVVAGANEGASNSEGSGNRPDDRRQSSSVSVNGQGTQVNTQMIDGVDNNERIIGNIGVRPSIDGIAEVRVQTNLYTAEVGRSAGAIINIITKSGTNEFHGSAFEFLRNDKLDANNFFTNRNGLAKPAYRQNQFGASLGGPIKHDKTFFFADYEALRFVQGTPSTATIPTAAMKAGIFTGVARIFDPLSSSSATTPRVEFPNDMIAPALFNPIAVKLLDTLPNPTSPGLANNYFTILKKTYYGHTADARVDHRFNEANQFFGRYTINNTFNYFPGQFPTVKGLTNSGLLPPGVAAGPGFFVQNGIQLHYIHTFQSNVLLDLRAAYLRFNNDAEPLIGTSVAPSAFGIENGDDIIAWPQFTFTGGYASLGESQFTPTHRIADDYEYSGTLGYIRGAHSFKFGAGYINRLEHGVLVKNGGIWAFSNQLTNNPAAAGGASQGDAIASFLLGYQNSGGTRTVPLNVQYPYYLEGNGFAQDDWRANRWLTLNMGIRYDVYTPPHDKYDRMANFDLNTLQYVYSNEGGVNNHAGVRTNKGNLAPRFGFAASLPYKMVLRGGYGITYYPGNTGTQYLGFNQRYQLSQTLPTATGISGLPPNLTLGSYSTVFNQPTANPPLPGAIAGTNWDFKETSVQQFNLTIEKAISDYIVSIAYVGLLSRHLSVQNFPLNNAPPGLGAVQQRRPYYNASPGLQAITIFMTNGVAAYHGLQLNVTKRLGQGLTFNANYTFAKCLSDAIQIGQGNPSFLELPDIRRNDYARCENDIRSRFAVTSNYELPFGRNATGLAKQLTGGWQLNVLASWQTGLPFSAYNSSAISNTGAANDRPNLVGDVHVTQPTVERWFNTAAFSPQAAGTIGNAGRNIMTGPPNRRIDLSLFKTFALSERFKLQFRAESFNLTNTADFFNPSGQLGAAAYGTIPSLQSLATPVRYSSL